jgi:hypothetical protein
MSGVYPTGVSLGIGEPPYRISNNSGVHDSRRIDFDVAPLERGDPGVCDTSRKYALAPMARLDEHKVTGRVGDERILY